MKNQSFLRRLSYSLAGIKTALKNESSFRTQSFFALGAVLLLIALRPKPFWWAIVILTAALVLAAELINTALEYTIDHLHPGQHSMIGKAKDCAAGAVLVLSLASLAVTAAMIWDCFSV